MTNPRFRPREYLRDPILFGRSEAAVWVEPTSNEEGARLRAAQLQHQYARRIKIRLRATGLTIGDFAQAVGGSADRTAKVLRGEVIMRIEDLSEAEFVLGGILTEPPPWA